MFFLKEDKILVDKFCDDCNVAKGTYLKDLRVKLTDPHTSQKSYWSGKKLNLEYRKALSLDHSYS